MRSHVLPIVIMVLGLANIFLSFTRFQHAGGILCVVLLALCCIQLWPWGGGS